MFNLILNDIGGWLGIVLFLLLQCGVHFCFAVSSREKCLPVMRYVLQAIALIIILLYFIFYLNNGLVFCIFSIVPFLWMKHGERNLMYKYRSKKKSSKKKKIQNSFQQISLEDLMKGDNQ